jgi:hypothetical protein
LLALPTFGEPFEVICDASIVDIGAIPLQKGQPIAFESQKLPLAKKNYTTGEQNLQRLHKLYTLGVVI